MELAQKNERSKYGIVFKRLDTLFEAMNGCMSIVGGYFIFLSTLRPKMLNLLSWMVSTGGRVYMESCFLALLSFLQLGEDFIIVKEKEILREFLLGALVLVVVVENFWCGEKLESLLERRCTLNFEGDVHEGVNLVGLVSAVGTFDLAL